MRIPLWLSALAISSALLVGCARTDAPPSVPTVPSARIVEFPAAGAAGDPREVHVLVDEPSLKLVTILLREGTVLPEHRSEVPVTIVALRGSGTVLAGTERLRLDATHAVALAPNVPHSVEPEGKTELLLLVHHLGHGKETHP